MGYGNPCCKDCIHKNDRCYCAPNSECNKYEKIQMATKKTWKEFRDSGMLWWINMILHTFGWAITVEIEDDGSISGAYPARVKFRGFSEKNNTEGYQKVSQYMKDNANDILTEAND